MSFHHYDFYGQELAKLERDHPRDRLDVGSMKREGLVKPERMLELFESVASQLIRYPAIYPEQLRSAVVDFARELK